MNLDLIKLFEKIRDLPLYNPEFKEDIDNRCWSKHRKLKKLFEKEGIRSRYIVCSFKWSEQRFPKEIINLPHDDRDYHLFLEVLMNNKWVVIDASNDSKLPEFNKWDGKNNCKIAVSYIKIFSPEESEKIEEDERKSNLHKIEKNSKFYKEVNIFLNRIRKR